MPDHPQHVLLHHGVDYVEYASTNLPATQTFYEAVFGWKFTSYGEAYIAFEDGRMSGGFYHVDETSPKGGGLVVIYSEDLEATQAAIVAAGGRIVRDIFSFPGGRRFHYEDPGGSEWAVWSDRDAAGCRINNSI